jgi:4,5-DOPA dioxygenase extradiol
MRPIFLGHGAPPLLDDPVWVPELQAWSRRMDRPSGILIVSAHWESAPAMLSAPDAGTPLIYDFGGFAPHYYEMTYPTPDASALAALVASLFPDDAPLLQHPHRGLDHGAWVPLKVMYPEADIPVLQLSLPSVDPELLMRMGTWLRPLRDHGVLIIGSGFLTHGLPFLRDWTIDATPPGWSVDFDLWAADALARGDVEELMAFRDRAPGMPYAHPTVEHLTPLFVALGAAEDAEAVPDTEVEGYFMGLAKRSFTFA